MCKPDRSRRGHAQKQRGEEPLVRATEECDLMVLLYVIMAGGLLRFLSQLSLISLSASVLYHFWLSAGVCGAVFFPADIQSLQLLFFSVPKSVPPCVISMHGSSSPRVR